MKRRKIRFINEDAAVQPATVAADVNTQEESLDDITQDTDNVANNTPTLQAQDVNDLEDKDVMNYVYFNVPQDIDDSTRQALFNRADQIRQKQMNGSTTPKDQEEFAKGVIAAAAQTKNKAKLGESLDYSVQAWVNAIRGKSGKKGRNGSANWDGDNLYHEMDEEEDDGRVHYYNQWIGKVDRTKKILYINDEVAPSGTVNNLIQAARAINFTPKRTNKTMELIDMGYEDDADPMYTEAYTSGFSDTIDEPYYGGGESDWGIDEEDSTYHHSYIPTKTSDEYMRTKGGQRSKMLMDLKDEVAERIEELTDGDIEYTEVYDFVDAYIDKAHKKYSNEELKRFSKAYRGKVDFFAKIILMKFEKEK